MRTLSVSLFVGVAIVATYCISAPQQARADIIYSYEIPTTQVVFGWGVEEFSGSLSWDATTSTISNVNISMSPFSGVTFAGNLTATFTTALSDTTSTLIDLDTATADAGGVTYGFEFQIGLVSPGLSGGSTVSMNFLYYFEYSPADASILGGTCSDSDCSIFAGNGLGQNSPEVDFVPSTTPVPSAALLFVGGLGVLGLMALFKRRNNAVSLAAA